MTTQQDSATPAAEVSPESDDALLQDVDFGETEAPPPGEQSTDQVGQEGGSDVGGGDGGGDASSDGEGEGDKPITLTQAELDARIEEVRREVQSARDSEFDTIRNELNELKQGSTQSAMDLAEREAVDDVTQAIMRDDPSVTSAEARQQAQRAVRAERQRFETGQELNNRALTLDEREQQIAEQGRSLAAQQLKIEYGLTEQQAEDVLRLPDSASMKLVAGLYRDANAATANTDKANQEKVEGQRYDVGGATDDIVPSRPASGDAELDSLMNLDTRDGTLSPSLTKEMEDQGWTP